MAKAVEQEIIIEGDDVDCVQFVIYDNPTDYHGMVIVRPWCVKNDANPGEPIFINYHWTFKTVAAARKAILKFRPWATHYARDPKDEPQIVEMWW